MAPAATSIAPSRGPTALQKPTKVRYFKGKLAGAEAAESSDEDDSDGEDDGQELLHRPGKARKVAEVEEDRDVVAGGAGRVFRPAAPVIVGSRGKGVKMGAVKMELGDVKLGQADIKKGTCTQSIALVSTGARK